MLILATRSPELLGHWQRAVDGRPHRTVDSVAALNTEIDAGAATVLLDEAFAGTPPWQTPWWSSLVPRVRWIYAAGNPDDDVGLEALQHGCAGFCAAYAAPVVLQQVLSVVESGEVWVGRSLLGRLLGTVQRQVPSRPPMCDWHAPLSQREREVAQMAASGLSNKDIGRRLDITERTVKAHMSAVLDKLGAKDRLQLALMLKGLIPA